MGERTANVQEMEIGPTLEGLARVIHERATERPEGSYTVRLLAEGAGDKLLSKLAEESSEIIMACKDDDQTSCTTCWWCARSTASRWESLPGSSTRGGPRRACRPRAASR